MQTGYFVKVAVGLAAPRMIMSDISRSDLTYNQIALRGLIVGGENAITDIASSIIGDKIGDPVGAAATVFVATEGGPISAGTGGLIGKYAVQYLASQGLDEI